MQEASSGNTGQSQAISIDNAVKFAPLAAVAIAFVYGIGYICAGSLVDATESPGIELPREKIIALGTVISLLTLLPIVLIAKFKTLLNGSEISNQLFPKIENWTHFILYFMFVHAIVIFIAVIAVKEVNWKILISSLLICFVETLCTLLFYFRGKRRTLLSYSMQLIEYCISSIYVLLFALAWNSFIGTNLLSKYGGPEFRKVIIESATGTFQATLIWIDQNSLALLNSKGSRIDIPRSDVKRIEYLDNGEREERFEWLFGQPKP